MRRRKGQYEVIEHVLLFGLGLAIASGFLMAFQSFGNQVEKQTKVRQAKLLGEVIGSHVTHLRSTDSTGRLSFSLPASIANRDYRVEFVEQGVQVWVGTESYTVPLSGAGERYNLSGSVTNDFATAVIIKRGSQFNITGQ
ncbi:MAG: hypothetical protein SVU32_03590 [Candidatus Nanohaloarchaea archaeon]|nr:hypothetical protein [Candidatus Nanohaloarchaea archaeon]